MRERALPMHELSSCQLRCWPQDRQTLVGPPKCIHIVSLPCVIRPELAVLVGECLALRLLAMACGTACQQVMRADLRLSSL